MRGLINSQRALLPVINTTCQRVQNCSGLLSPPHCDNGQNSQAPPFSAILISHSTHVLNFWHSMNYSSVGPLSVNSTLNHTYLTNYQRNCILCKNSTQRLELTNEIRCLGLGHITQAKNEEPNTKLRHGGSCSTKIFLSFCVSSIIQSSYTLELRRTCNSVSLHCLNRTKDPYLIHCKQS